MTKGAVFRQYYRSFLNISGYNQGDMFEDFMQNLYAQAAALPFDTLVWLVWGSFGGLFLLTLLLSAGMPKVRRASKTPFLCLANVYTMLTFATFLIKGGVAQAAFVSAVFWVVGYVLYGALCFMSREKIKPAPVPEAFAAAAPAPVKAPQSGAKPSAPIPSAHKTPKTNDIPAAKSNVRLEHAITVTDRLLERELGKTDRQELEKLKNTLEVLRVKGTLSPAEGEILNENFNMLLKLMAKYNV